jgi:hypothetical protein
MEPKEEAVITQPISEDFNKPAAAPALPETPAVAESAPVEAY